MSSGVSEPPGRRSQNPAELDRRGALRLGAASVASFTAACAEPEEAPKPSSAQTSAAGGSPTTEAGTGDVEAATTESTTTAPSADLPPREDIVRRYAEHDPAAFGLEVPGVVLRHPGPGVALTFDLCGGPQGDQLDHDLWTLLQDHKVASTFFVNSRWLDANPSLARELGADPLIEIANHGHQHRPLSVDGRAAYGIRGTRDAGMAHDEVAEPVAALTDVGGTAPLWFRSGTAHCDDVGVRIAESLGQRVVNFSINGDAGATFDAQQVSTDVGRAGDGGIVIAHANQPGSGTAAGLALALPALLDRGVTFVGLADVLPSAAG